MKKITLKIKKKKCKSTCPVPLDLIPNIEKGIKKIDYDKKSGIGKIAFDARSLSKKKIVGKLKKIGYEVKE